MEREIRKAAARASSRNRAVIARVRFRLCLMDPRISSSGTTTPKVNPYRGSGSNEARIFRPEGSWKAR